MKPHLRTTVQTLLERGESQREIERRTGVDRKTIRRLARAAKSPTPATGSAGLEAQNPPPWPPGPDGPEGEEPGMATGTVAPAEIPPDQACQASACEEHRAWIEAQVRLGLNAVAIYQELVAHSAQVVHQFRRKPSSGSGHSVQSERSDAGGVSSLPRRMRVWPSSSAWRVP